MLDPLEAYFRLLTQWNAKINLTALPLEPPTDETFDRLLIEPLAAAPQLETGSDGWAGPGSDWGLTPRSGLISVPAADLRQFPF